MISASTGSASVETESKRKRTHRAPTDTAMGWCLVASGDSRVRSLLVAAAREGGWKTKACRSPIEAVREAVLHRAPLALVDIGSVEDRASQSDLIRMVRGSSQGLVVVCDRSSNVDGELWARQEGAWVYLSGVDEASDVASICRQAKRLTEERQRGGKGHPTLVG